MPTEQKREFSTFSITYWGEDDRPKETIQVRSVPLRGKKSSLRDVIALQDELIKAMIEHNVCIGSLVADDSVWKNMVSLAAILPVVGRANPGFDIEALAEAGDIAQLGRIFFTESITLKGEHEVDENGDRPLTKPSSIARIHDINFHTPLFKYNEERQTRLQEEQMKRIDNVLQEQISPVAAT